MAAIEMKNRDNTILVKMYIWGFLGSLITNPLSDFLHSKWWNQNGGRRNEEP